MVPFHRIANLTVCVALLIGMGSVRSVLAEDEDESIKAANAADADHADEGGRHAQGAEGTISSRYADEIERLRELSAGSTEPCVNALYVAAKDRRVRALFLKKATNPHYVFKTVRCLDGPIIPEYKFVLFDFDCRPDVFCLIDPNFLVIVDAVNAKVVDIVDPYLGGSPKARIVSSRRAEKSLAFASLVEIDAVGTNYKFTIDGADNPPIRVNEGDMVKVTFTSADHNHDWKLVFVENGEEREWAKTPVVENGQTASVEFEANRVGEFDYFCSVGNHRARGMRGKFIVDPQ